MASIASPELDLQSKLEETSLTVEWLLNVLEKHDENFVKSRGNSKVLSVQCHNISEGNGFCSNVLKTIITFDTNQTYSVVLKVPTEKFILKLVGNVTGMTSEQLLNEILTLHDIEIDAYNLLKDIQDFPLAKIYYMEKSNIRLAKNGVIVMEDLSENCITTGLFKSVTPQHCLEVAKHFGQFQAYVEGLDKELWEDKYITSIYTREDLVENERRGIFPALEYKNGAQKDKIQFFLDIDWHKFSCYTVKDRAQELGCLTLCHGDFWVNNLLIQLNGDGSVSNRIGAIIDWQTMFKGSPLHDLSRFIITCADGEVRREIQWKAVDLFYDRLTEKLEAQSKKPRFTREQAYELYELASLQQTQILVKVFTYLAMPFLKTGKSEDEAKVEKIWLRLRLALKDAQPIIEKYDIRNKFAVKSD